MSNKHKSLGKNYRAKSSNTIINNSDNWFPTYWNLTRHLLKRINDYITDDTVILEPCAGAGDITRVIKEYHPHIKIIEIDINPRRPGIIKKDFFKCKNIKCDMVITNPPFKLALEFFKKAAEFASDSIFMLWPLDYLHGVERWETIYNKGYNFFNLRRVFAFVRRPLFDAKYHPGGPMPTGATSFAWFWFAKNYLNKPSIEWLHNNSDMGIPWEVAQITMQDFEMKNI